MKKILLSLAVIAIAGGAVAGFTTAFYGDTETSTGNTFTAGAVELSIDSVAHYNGLECILTDSGYLWLAPGGRGAQPAPEDAPFHWNTACEGTWAVKDLDGEKFFNFNDLKPGDFGENTISVHVTSNDSWLAARFIGYENADNTVLDPENDSLAEDGLDGQWCGELAQSMIYTAWVDDGITPGWQCGDLGAMCTADPEEGDNVRQGNETVLELDQLILTADEAAAACASLGETDTLDTDWIVFGQVPGGETHYYGIEWSLPLSVGNEAQSDSILMDIQFGVEQVRNNPTPFQPLP